MTTRGDQILDRPLAKMGGKGLFIKELEAALLEGRADIAVHSMKDVPMVLEEEFTLACITAREMPFDAFVSSRYDSLDDMPPGAVVGTSSLRRESQVHAQYPFLAVTSLRGNLDTRLRKLDEGQFDAIILAAAGLRRLGLESRIRAVLPAEVSLPSAGQGALGIECLAARAELVACLQALADADTTACVIAERAFSRALAGNCETPLGVFGEMRAGRVFLRGFVALPDGSRVVRGEREGAASEAESLGRALAEALLAQGAGEILAELG
jgi:hydroxymethylbilane synthase